MKRTLTLLLLAGTLNAVVKAQCSCGQAAQLSTLSDANTPGGGNDSRLLVELSADYRTFNDLPVKQKYQSDTLSYLKNSTVYQLRGSLKVNQAIALQVSLPWLQASSNTGTVNSLADAALLLSYNKRWKQQCNIGINAGAELPTGKVYPVSTTNMVAIPGSGSIDPVLGANFSFSPNRLLVKISSFNKLSTLNANNDNFGSYWSQSIMAGYKWELAKSDTSCVKPNYLVTTSSVLAEQFGSQVQSGKKNYQSGGILWSLAVGANWLQGNWNVGLSMYLPVYQNWWNKYAVPIAFRGRTSISYSF